MAEQTFPRIVEDRSERNGPKAEICVECRTMDEAFEKGTRELVLNHASKIGMTRPGFSGGAWTEWVNEQGETIRGEEFKAAAVKYVRAHYPIQEGL